MNSPRHPLSALLLCGLLLLIPDAPAQAGSATWKQNPSSGDWFTTANWTPATIPDGPTQIATFRASGVTDVTMHPSPTGFDQLDSIVFQNGASPFTIRPQFLEVGGAGISNLSGLTQNFVNDVYLNSISLLVGSRITFSGNASAGVQCTYTNNPGAIPNTNPSAVIFVDDANAGSSVFINNASATSDSTGAGVVFFENNSSAAQATIINNGGTGLALSGATVFFDTSTADAATIVVNGSSGGTIGGVISFATDSTGGTAAVRLNGDGTLSLGNHNPPGVAIGSLEGDGVVLLASNNLTIGTNNSSRTFSGSIADGDGFSGGSLTKVGTAKLTLTSANTYTGGTTINAGTLFVTNQRGSGTGSGQVQISGGKLGGTGKIAGDVIVGNGSLPEAFLSPGIANGIPAILTLQKKVTFRADATLHFGYETSNLTADHLIVRGVTISSGAELFFGPIDSGTLPIGTLFTVIDNRAGTPIAGTFSNIPDGGTVTVGSNTFQANYEGGDGNDLTLTVVP